MIGNTALDEALQKHPLDDTKETIKRKREIADILRKKGKLFKKCENVVKKHHI